MHREAGIKKKPQNRTKASGRGEKKNLKKRKKRGRGARKGTVGGGGRKTLRKKIIGGGTNKEIRNDPWTHVNRRTQTSLKK